MIRKKSVLVLFCMMLCVLLCMATLTGCGNEEAKESVSQTVEPDVQHETESIEDGMYIMLYMLNEDSWETEIDADTEDADAELTTTLVAEISKKDLNAETIVTKYNEIVVQSMYGELFAVNQVRHADHNVIIDFDGASLEAVGITEGEEGQLFYNLARSIDENLGDVAAIYLTMDGGKDFCFGHLWFTASEPFYTGRGIAE